MARNFAPILFLILSYPLMAQTDSPRYRGFIPPLFKVPTEGVHLNFTSPSKPDFKTPEYPSIHRTAGHEGATEVEMYVTSEGKVVYAVIRVSSGDKHFDEAALSSAMKTTFPQGYATLYGQPQDFTITVPYYFLLSSDPEHYWHTRLELARVQQEYEAAMKEFQNYTLERTKASRDRFEKAKQRLEEKVGQAKRLYRILAEKKESAILRLRAQITEMKDIQETPELDTRWRELKERTEPVVITNTRQGVHSISLLEGDELQRLQHELEVKKSYF